MEKQTGKGFNYSKTGIAVSIIVAVIVVLVCNVAGYKYIQAQAISTESEVTSMQAWVGIQKLDKPVDILLLGDSACRVDLTTGPFSDRLGGSVLNLGNTAQTSLLTDGWMLQDYINKFGAPKMVVVMRTSVGYAVTHNIEFMANPPLPWGYWNSYGLPPVWQKGEMLQLFLAKYGVLNSDADVLQQRLTQPWSLFSYSIQPRAPSHSYSAGDNTTPKVPMDVATQTPAYYFDKFYYSADSTNAIKHMTALARKYHFQLYFTMQCEWDQAVNAGLRSAHIAAEMDYLSKFADNTYVHVVDQLPKTLFTTDQMESPNHLWHGSEQIYTEEIVNGITAVQNELTAKQAAPLEETAVSLDKSTYAAGDTPDITVSVSSGGTVPTSQVSGSVSCLVKPSGGIDGDWVIRAPAVAFTLGSSNSTDVHLQLIAGQLSKAGNYDVVIFLRQDVGTLSHETRIEMPNLLVVK